MRFTKQKDHSYLATSGRDQVHIYPDEGGWQVRINGVDIEWFMPNDLQQAKAFAKARVAR